MLPRAFRPTRRPAEHGTQLRRLPLQAESGTIAFGQTMAGRAVASAWNENTIKQNTKEKSKKLTTFSSTVFLLQNIHRYECKLSDGKRVGRHWIKQRGPSTER